MANEIEVGAILEGKVTGITKFGAFVSLPGGKSGLVHISEIAYSYVSDVNDHLTVGQDVKVKVINIDENNRINLSIKKALPAPPRQAGHSDRGSRPQGDRPNRPQGDRSSRPQGDRSGYRQQGGNRDNRSEHSDRGERSARPQNRSSAPRTSAPKEPQSFDDMLKQFMSDSDSKLSGSSLYSDKPTRRRNNNGGRRN